MKIRRFFVQKKYAATIDAMYDVWILVATTQQDLIWKPNFCNIVETLEIPCKLLCT